jgi:hypothetical protein
MEKAIAALKEAHEVADKAKSDLGTFLVDLMLDTPEFRSHVMRYCRDDAYLIVPDLRESLAHVDATQLAHKNASQHALDVFHGRVED